MAKPLSFHIRQQNRRYGRGHLNVDGTAQLIQNVPEVCAISNHFKRTRFRRVQCFGLLTILNVRSCRVPTNDFAVFTEQGVVLDQKPSVTTVFAARPLFIFKRCGSEESFLPRFSKSLNVLRMENALSKVVRQDFVEGKPRILKCDPIRIYGFPVWVQNDDRLRNKIDDLLQILFFLTEASLGAFARIATFSRDRFLDGDSSEARGHRVRALMLWLAANVLRGWGHYGPCWIL